MLILSFSKTKEIGKKVAKLLKTQYANILVDQFPDKELKINLNKNPKNKKVVIIQSFDNPNKSIMETLLAAYTAKELGCKKIILVATYLSYLRQDKAFKKYEAVSAKIILKILSDVFDKIYIIDPHLHRIKNIKQLSKKAIKITANNLIADYIKKNFKFNETIIIGPDKESCQWAKSIAKMLKTKVCILRKNRLSPRKVEICGDIKEKNIKRIIIIDDIISTGKTMCKTIKLIKEHTKENICIGIHGLFSENADKNIKKHSKLITTNTIQNKYSKIDVSKIIADALKK